MEAAYSRVMDLAGEVIISHRPGSVMKLNCCSLTHSSTHGGTCANKHTHGSTRTNTRTPSACLSSVAFFVVFVWQAFAPAWLVKRELQDSELLQITLLDIVKGKGSVGPLHHRTNE